MDDYESLVDVEERLTKRRAHRTPMPTSSQMHIKSARRKTRRGNEVSRKIAMVRGGMNKRRARKYE